MMNMSRRNGAMRLAVTTLVAATALALAPSAGAAFSITEFAATSSSSMAGAHPDLTTTLRFASFPTTPPFQDVDGNVRDVTVNLPPGFIGDRSTVPECSQSAFSGNACPASAQIGTVTASLLTHGGFPFPLTMPVYNMEPRNAEETAEIAFSSQFITVHIQIAVRTDSDFGLTAHVIGTTHSYAVTGVELRLWGVPADPSHDGSRLDMGLQPIAPPGNARVPFLTNPTSCDGPLTFTAKANSYQDQSTFSEAQSTLPQLSQCDIVPFSPELSFQPTSRKAGAPSGYESVLTVPQNMSADGRSSAHLRNAVVSLPAGVAINPSGSVGLGGCDNASLHLRSTAPAACPDDAKIGSAEFDVPVLPKPIKGAIYLRQPLPGDLFRIVLVADDFGVHLKIPGNVKADPVTGQLTATFADTPQVPFSKLTLSFDGGPHAALVNPTACGVYTTHAKLTPWSGADAVPVDSSFTIDQGCGQEGVFSPGFSAGMKDPTAGAQTSFHLRITRDGGPALSTVATVMPRGLLANIKDVPQCPEARAAAGTCGPDSQIGRTTVGAGAGADPVFLPQPGKAPTAVYLAGPYKGAPFSLSIVVPAQSGPFDLGTVVVRAGLYIDPVTAQVTVKADPLPTILEGIPLNIRDVRVDIDRPGFTFNPTNCDPQTVAGSIGSTSGQVVQVSSPFRVVDCEALGFAPKLTMALSGKGQTTDGKHPALTAHLAPRSGDANTRQTRVTLPLSLALDPGNANGLCEPVAAAANRCPAKSIVGSAQAQSVLPDPLKGPVYFVRGERKDPKSGRIIKTLPKLFIPLSADGVTIYVNASSDVEDDRLVTTFDNLPDAPFSSFDLSIAGGRHGILAVSDANVCAKSQVASATFTGQNAKELSSQVTMGTPCAFGIVKSSHTSKALKVTVGGVGAGKLTVSGNGIVKTSRTLAAATTATVESKLRTSTASRLAHGHNVTIKVKVVFAPKGKKARTATKKVVLHGV
jgi:hypothetical protein